MLLECCVLNYQVLICNCSNSNLFVLFRIPARMSDFTLNPRRRQLPALEPLVILLHILLLIAFNADEWIELVFVVLELLSGGKHIIGSFLQA